ncbi:MAG: hypothetical protein NTW51_04325 [Cyanobacteria bacterium]|nr:hypothetical protein [Cyanobacteriota bacterium]
MRLLQQDDPRLPLPQIRRYHENARLVLMDVFQGGGTAGIHEDHIPFAPAKQVINGGQQQRPASHNTHLRANATAA